jgi:hypothetical protein
MMQGRSSVRDEKTIRSQVAGAVFGLCAVLVVVLAQVFGLAGAASAAATVTTLPFSE